MIRADHLCQWDWDAGIAEFGEDRYFELISNNVAPGWNKVWIVGCEDPCRFDEIFDELATRWTVDGAEEIERQNAEET